jgi:hypothetical protein
MASQIPGPTAFAPLPSRFYRIIEARHHDPFEVLGKHREGTEEVVRVCLPNCSEVRMQENGEALARVGDTPVFESDAGYYSGSGFPVQGQHHSEPVARMNQAQSILLDLPPLAGVIFLKD